jgi:nitrite reductase/ring-hydroxylating ferredoxin subunit
VSDPEARLEVDADLPVGSIVAAEIDGVPYAVIRYDEGWTMVEDRCTHARCSFVEGGEVVDGTVLVCACHGSEFDLRDGSVLQGPATADLAPIALVADGDGLRVDDAPHRPSDGGSPSP